MSQRHDDFMRNLQESTAALQEMAQQPTEYAQPKYREEPKAVHEPEQEPVVNMESMSLAMDAQRLGESELNAIAIMVFKLRYGLLVQMAEEMKVDHKTIHDWANSRVALIKD